MSVPDIQGGTFADANICVAQAVGRTVKFKNVTAVAKFRIPALAKPVKVVSIKSVDAALSGDCIVDLSSGTPVVKSENTSTGVLVKTEGSNGNFYASIIPGNYGEGFSLSAIALDLKEAVEFRESKASNTLHINDLVDLGIIGENLKPLQGDGSEGNPWLIKSFPEWMAFTYYVNEGNKMENQHIKLMTDISDVTTVIGVFDDDIAEKPDAGTTKYLSSFAGNFDGNNHTITLAINQSGKKAAALFGLVEAPASIVNLNVAGRITSQYHYAAGVAAVVKPGNAVSFKKCHSSVKIKSGGYAGGIVGFCKNASTLIESCKNTADIEAKGAYYVGGIAGNFENGTVKESTNSGAVSGGKMVAGIIGRAVNVHILDCNNIGDIVSTLDAGKAVFYFKKNGKTYISIGDLDAGSAGIVAYCGDGEVKRCENKAKVTGQTKVGGICGSGNGILVVECKNSGAVNALIDGNNYVGGIVGWTLHKSTIYDCHNTGQVSAKKHYAGGIVGYAQALDLQNTGRAVLVKGCTNKAEIGSETGNCIGGIVGMAYSMNNLSMLRLIACSNISESVVSGSSYVGGILGAEDNFSRWSRVNVENCCNAGQVVADNTVGGILGGMFKPIEKQGVYIKNCYNTGHIKYIKADNANPYIGGIAGRIKSDSKEATLQNNYNTGRISPVKADEPIAALGSVGAIVGYSDTGTKIDFAYFKSDCYEGAAVTGSGSKNVKGAYITGVAADGTLGEALSINGNAVANIIDALNAWVDGNSSFYAWTSGPKFVYPSYSDPIDAGGFDLGNGGEI